MLPDETVIPIPSNANLADSTELLNKELLIGEADVSADLRGFFL